MVFEKLRKYTDCQIYYDDGEDSFDLFWDNNIVPLDKDDVKALIPKLQEWLDGL